MEAERSIMRGTGQGLLEFCDRVAERGDMNPSTARALRSTVKNVLAVEAVDADAIDLRKLDVDDLLERFVKLRKADFSEGSIATYRSRFPQGVAMYLAWLDDDPKWKTAGRVKRSSGNGSPATTRRAPVRRTKPTAAPPEEMANARTVPANEDTRAIEAPSGIRLITYDVPLRPDLIVRVTLPIDLTTNDAERFATFVRSLAFSGQTQGSETSLPEGEA